MRIVIITQGLAPIVVPLTKAHSVVGVVRRALVGGSEIHNIWNEAFWAA